MDGTRVMMSFLLFSLLLDIMNKCLVPIKRLGPLIIKSTIKVKIYLMGTIIKKYWPNYVMFILAGVLMIYGHHSFVYIFLPLLIYALLYPVLIHHHNIVIKILPFIFIITLNIVLTAKVSVIIGVIFIVSLCAFYQKDLESISTKTDLITYVPHPLMIMFIKIIGLTSIFLLIIKNEILTDIPLEQVVFLGLLFILAKLEGLLTSNRNELLNYKSRFMIHLFKTNRVTSVLIPEKFRSACLELLYVVLTILLANLVVKRNIADFILLLLALVMQVLFSLDILINHCLLSNSHIYNNKTTRFLCDIIVNTLSFQILVLYSGLQLSETLNDLVIIHQLRLAYFIIVIILNILLWIRIKGPFWRMT